MSLVNNSFLIVEDSTAKNKWAIVERVNNQYYYLCVQLGRDSYRSLKGASISCSRGLLELIAGQKELVERKLEQCKTVNDLARELQLLIEKLQLNSQSAKQFDAPPFHYYNAVLHDIESLGWNNISSISDTLQRITIVVPDPSNRSHDVTITLPASYPDGTPQCQLGLPQKVAFQWKRTNPLSSILSAVRSIINRFDDVWSVLEDLDKHCIVIDPTNPTFEHNYRRIYLQNQCSMMYTVNVEKPFAMGEMLIVGPAAQKEVFEKRLNEHLREWDMSVLPRVNMEHMLQLTFPQPSQTDASQYEIECAICYSYQLEYHGKTVLPDKSCPNEKCARVFHYSCLLDMLRSNPTTKQSFNTLYGCCPYCQTPLSLNLGEGLF
ncbi:E3 ubiquitin-protein ligase [Blastocystis sp. ATCC 50177/Nand II]|uniref:E3 ubiquitin-protein ligase n=1 Tax=Blastocystis sp. subtype 1 (strain ATCC 50177 / NandII) TaxID=478820 RepID=A0A196S7E7_BLAHN|nr:E3 ubiquitin-protein ligase [Blastocystis sp. ATCC 50177/Nand II]